MNIRILHLSDIHLNSLKIQETNNKLKKMISSLKRYNEEKTIDFIFVTGDLVDKGGKSFDNDIEKGFEKFNEVVVENLVNEIKIDKENIIIVPGNHDILESENTEVIDAYLEKKLVDKNSIDEYVNKILTDSNEKKEILKYKEFERKIYNQKDDNIFTCLHSCFIRKIGNINLGVVAFNTTWRCYTKSDMVMLGKKQIYDANEKIEKCDIKIALMHHHPDTLVDFEKDEINNLIRENFDVLCCGHVHKGDEYKYNDLTNEIYVSIGFQNSESGSNTENVSYLNGYWIIDLCVEENKIKVFENKFMSYDYQRIGSSKTINYIFNINNEKENMSIKENNYDKDQLILNSSKILYDLKNGNTKTNIKFKEINSPFYSNINLIRDCLLKTIQNDDLEIQEFLDKLEDTLIIMDRYLYYHKDDILFKDAVTIINNFNNINEFKFNNDNEFNILNDFYYVMEWWLRLISLDLNYDLTEKELSYFFSFKNDASVDSTLVKLFEDNIKIIDCIKYKNKFEIKKQYLTASILLGYILFVYKNKNDIAHLTRNIYFDNEAHMNRYISSNSYVEDYKSHLKHFVGRENVIEEIRKNIKDKQCTLVLGDNNVGKTAIIYKSLLEDNSISPIILYSFKEHKTIDEIFCNLIEQCNERLIKKVDMEDIYKLKTEFDYEKTNKLYVQYLYEAISRVTVECNELYLILDSIESDTLFSDIIKSLITKIPKNCYLILLSIEDTEFIKWINDKKILTNVYKLRSFSKDDLENIFNNLDIDSIDLLYKKTNGDVSAIRKLLEENDGKVTKMAVSKLKKVLNINDKYECRAGLWLDNDIMEECLLLLAIFEEIQPLSLNSLQMYLFNKNIKIKMPVIRRELKKVQDQVNEIRFNRIKLLDKEYARYILEEYYSENDIKVCINDIFSWYISDKNVDIALICNTLIYILTKSEVTIDNLIAFVEEFLKVQDDPKKVFYIGRNLFVELEDNIDLAFKFLDKAIELNYSDALAYKGYIYMHGKKVNKNELFSEKLLLEASDLGNLTSKIILSEKYFQEGKLELALKLLEEASKLGSEKANLNLAIRYIYGDCVKQDISQGINILMNLIDNNNIYALYILGKSLLYGIFVERDVEKGKEYIKKSMHLGDQVSKYTYSRYIIENEEDNNEGFKYLRELVNDNHEAAELYYAKLLLGGKFFSKNIQKGIEIIENLVDRGYSKCIIEYSIMLIEGKYINQDIHKGILFLNKEIEIDNYDAMITKGDYLIDGIFVEKNVEEGINLLQFASKYKDEALVKLGMRYAYGMGVDENFNLGISYLKEAIKKGSLSAKVSYSRIIINKKEISIDNKYESISILEDAVKSRFPSAQVLLAEVLFSGKIIDKNPIRAKKLLEDAINQKYPVAMRELGYRYLTGNGIKKDIALAINFLNMAISEGDILSKTILGHEIIEKRLYGTNVEYGLKMLREAANNGEDNACEILGLVYIKGKYVERNINKGKLLLMKAIEEKNASASLELAKMLLDGIYLKEDKKKGNEILEDLVSKGVEAAEIELANRLIDNNGVDKDYKRAINLFEGLIDKNNLDAKCDYAINLINGQSGFIKDIKTGEKLLRESELEGHRKSRYYLAVYLIEGILEKNYENEGDDLLNLCISLDDINAIRFYINKLLYGKKEEKDINKALDYYEKLVKLNDLEGITDYALELIYGEQINKNVFYGLSLLKDTVKQGYLKGKFEYANLLIDGTIINQNLDVGIRFIDELIDIGYSKAKRYIAYKYALGDKVERNIDKAIELYEELYNDKDYSSIIKYSQMLLNGVYVPRNSIKAEKMLKELVEEGIDEAKLILAERYTQGKGLRKMVKKGKHYYERLSGSKNPMIKFKLGLMLKYKEANNKKGDSLINESIDEANASELYEMGVGSYKKYFKKNDIKLSARIFKKAYELGNNSAGVSLAYLIRRDEISQIEFELPSVDVLLENELDNGNEVAIINKALLLIKNNNSDEVWIQADNLIKGLNKCTDTAEWWDELIREESDKEGMLVIGWLERYNLIYTSDPDYRKKFKILLNSGYYIPEWLMGNFENDNLLNNQVALTSL